MPASFRDTPLAIVGMACRFPGGETLDDFWSLVRDGRSAFAPLPKERFDPDLHWSPKKGEFARTDCRLLGQVTQGPVDPRIIEIPDDVAARFDMTHLTLCEVAASACRDAGYDPKRLPYRNTGIYLGNSSVGDLEGDVTFVMHARQLAERLRLVPQFAALAADVRTKIIRDTVSGIRGSCPAGTNARVESFASHAAAGLIASLFGTLGPALVTDSACASSFTALYLAAQALHLGTVDMAIVGAGACRSWCEVVLMAVVQATSAGGSRPFDAEADGLVPADGYGALVVKTLPRAQADGDRIVGVIRGIGMSTDGKGKGFWAPRTEGQVACMRRAQAMAGGPSRVQYVHAHATSTQLGDVTEMESLATVFGDSLAEKIPVSSVKGNIGHTLEAAGMAGLVATLLAMRNETIPPAANFKTPNPDIPWNEIPFYAPTKASPWPWPADGGPRRAAVNAFGIGGINLNVVVEDVPENAVRHFAPSPSVLAAEPASSQSPASETQELGDEIAVIGVGCVLPGAHNVEQFRALLDSGRDALSDVPAGRWDASLPAMLSESNSAAVSARGGFLTGYQFDWKKHRIAPIQVANANPLQFLLLDATDQALSDAGYAGREFDRSRAAALVGAPFSHEFCADAHLGVRLPEFGRVLTEAAAKHGIPAETAEAMAGEHRARFIKDKPAVKDETGSYSSSTLATRVAKQLDFGGGAMSIDAGDASGLAALGAAIDLLRLGDVDLVVCCSGQRNMDLTRFAQLARSNIGPAVIPAEGAVAFVLKRLGDARRDGDSVRAVLRPIAAATDPNAVADAVTRTLGLAFVESDPGQVRRIRVVTPSPSAKDRIEAAPGARQRTSNVTVEVSQGRVAPRIGHVHGAASLCELLAAILEEPGAEPGDHATAGTIGVGAVNTEGFVSKSGGSAWLLPATRPVPHDSDRTLLDTGSERRDPARADP